jgi:hypothetical protein
VTGMWIWRICHFIVNCFGLSFTFVPATHPEHDVCRKAQSVAVPKTSAVKVQTSGC